MITELSAKYYEELIAKQIAQETMGGNSYSYEMSVAQNSERRRNMCKSNFAQELSSFLLSPQVSEKQLVYFLENFEKNFPKSSSFGHIQLNQTSFVPDFWSLQKRNAWDSFHLYDLCVFYGFKEAQALMEKKYAAQLYSFSVSTLMCVLNKSGIQVVSPDNRVSPMPVFPKSLDVPAACLRFYKELKTHINLTTAENHNNFRLIDFLSKSRAYGELENVEQVYTSSYYEPPPFDPVLSKKITSLYDYLLEDQLSQPGLGLKILDLGNTNNYNYTPLDYALYAENYYFIDKVINFVAQKSNEDKQLLNSFLAKRDLSKYKLRKDSVKNHIYTAIEKSRLEDMLSNLPKAISSAPLAVSATKKKTNKI